MRSRRGRRARAGCHCLHRARPRRRGGRGRVRRARRARGPDQIVVHAGLHEDVALVRELDGLGRATDAIEHVLPEAARSAHRLEVRVERQVVVEGRDVAQLLGREQRGRVLDRVDGRLGVDLEPDHLLGGLRQGDREQQRARDERVCPHGAMHGGASTVQAAAGGLPVQGAPGRPATSEHCATKQTGAALGSARFSPTQKPAKAPVWHVL